MDRGAGDDGSNLLLYFFAGQQIVITHGFIKKTGLVPVSELDRAERLMQEWHQHGA